MRYDRGSILGNAAPLCGAILAVLLGVLPAQAVTLEQEAILRAFDGSETSSFGISVSLDGERALIGAPWASAGVQFGGAVYAFSRVSGSWSLDGQLVAFDAALFDRFGYSVSVDGETAVIGAPLDETGAGANSGSAYVFERVNEQWIVQTKLIASDGDANDEFGFAVDVDGDTIVIGARFDDDNGGDSGSAYVFVRTGPVWSEQDKLLAVDGGAGDVFGSAVDLDGDTVVIGASHVPGSAYAFTRTGSVWSQQAKLVASDTTPEEYGFSVSLDGNTAAIGAPGDTFAFDSPGAVYVFTRSGGAWTEQTKLVSPGPGDNLYGHSVDVDGDGLLIGDPVAIFFGTARAYLYSRVGGDWIEEAQIEPDPENPGSWFGNSVSLQPEAALIGAFLDDFNGQNAGAAYGYAVVPDDPGDGGDGGVPAVGEPGVLLLLLTFLASGAYFAHRRSGT
jgi:hypothetical protein